MKLSTRSRYGTRVMIDLVRNTEHGPISLKDLAQRQGVSLKYLEQIIPGLKNAGLILSTRGTKGGYVLAQKADQITVLDVVHALEGSLAPVDCVQFPEICSRVDNCVTRGVWEEMHRAVKKTLSYYTLQDLAQQKKNMQLGKCPK